MDEIYENKKTLDELFIQSPNYYSLKGQQIPIYDLKDEYAEEILSKVFPDERQKQIFENKSLSEQLSNVRIYKCYHFSENKLKLSDCRFIKIASAVDLANRYKKGESLEKTDSLPNGILAYKEQLLGIVWYKRLLWLGTTIYWLESDIDCSGDNNGAGYSGGGDVYEYIYTLAYISIADELKNTEFASLLLEDIEFFDASENEIIKKCAFENCRKLKKVAISDKLRIIEESAFKKCSSLEEVILPESLERIEESAFQGCSSLKRIVIPPRVTCIPKCAFTGCSSLEEIILPDSLEHIEDSAFDACRSLKRIVIPPRVTCIPKCAFMGCLSLEEVILPEGLECIEEWVFFNCPALKRIVIPPRVTCLSLGAFQECPSLEEVILPKSCFGCMDNFRKYEHDNFKVTYYNGAEEWQKINK
ncbi:MAG: leucine-rich repeat domain-containing protein [Clostridia bacterium]|nr:leucine-rich repeat domain-containing protein [Clostridia bacterium]